MHPENEANIAADESGCEAVARSMDGVLNLDAIDRRTRPYRRYEAIRAAVLSDLGGEANTSEVQRQLISKFATLALQLELLEAKSLDAEIDIDLFGRASGNLRRIAETLGLRRCAKDVTPSLAEYLAQKHGDDEAAA
jgi:hypothetical protein